MSYRIDVLGGIITNDNGCFDVRNVNLPSDIQVNVYNNGVYIEKVEETRAYGIKVNFS